MCCPCPEKDSYWFWVKRSRSNIDIELHLTFSNDTSYMGCPWPEEDPYWFLSPKVKTKFWELEFVAVEVSFDILSPTFHESKDIKTHLSIYPSVHHKNLNLAHIFWSMNDRAMIFGMHKPCDKPHVVTLTFKVKVVSGRGPQFSEFSKFILVSV